MARKVDDDVEFLCSLLDTLLSTSYLLTMVPVRMRWEMLQSESFHYQASFNLYNQRLFPFTRKIVSTKQPIIDYRPGLKSR
jgi:hypothetical protein